MKPVERRLEKLNQPNRKGKVVGEADRAWNVLRYVIVGMMETVAIGSMIGSSIFLEAPNGAVAILLGLVVGVLGLVIYDGWKV